MRQKYCSNCLARLTGIPYRIGVILRDPNITISIVSPTKTGGEKTIIRPAINSRNYMFCENCFNIKRKMIMDCF